MRNSAGRKNRAYKTPSIVSKNRRTRRRSAGAAVFYGHPLRVGATKLPRRRFLNLAAGAAALPVVSRSAIAQTYPSRPITMIVSFRAGGIQDVLGRIVAERMKESLGRPIIIENVTGTEGSIGAGRVAGARPDGYTIGLGSMGMHVLNGAFYPLPYDVLNGFAPIAPVATAPFVLYAKKTMPART